MFGWKKKNKEKSPMQELQESRLSSAKKKIDAAIKGMEILDSIRVNRRIENLGPDGHEERRASAHG